MKLSTASGAIEEVAARWFARRASGTWTDADQAQFQAWLEQRTAHRIAYIRLDAAWNHSARMRALGAGVPPGVIPPRAFWGDTRFFKGTPPDTHPPPAHGYSPETSETPDPGTVSSAAIQGEILQGGGLRSGRVRLRLLAVAATMLAFAVGIYIMNTGLFAGTHYSTPVGGIDNVPLADGSRITLNTDTSIRVAITEHERHIRLDKGEAFFEVAKDKSRPFVVYAGDKRVIAVGTKFSVRRDHDDIQVVVTEGRVNLAAAKVPSPRDRDGTPDEIPGKGIAREGGAGVSIPPSTFLSAGAIARTSRAEVLVRPDATTEAEKLLSWRNGYIVFDNTALADAVAEFNRYNTRKIYIEDPSIAAIRIGGNFRSNNSDAFLWLLQSGFPINVEQTEDKVVLKGR